MGIGLPNIEVILGISALPYFMLDNEDLTREDNGRRDVTLSLVNAVPLALASDTYIMDFSFENTNIEWLVLSELTMCDQPLEGK